jgi:uncharacterized protein (DUF305 family)
MNTRHRRTGFHNGMAAAAVAAALLTAPVAFAQTTPAEITPSSTSMPMTPEKQAMMQAMEKMDRGMAAAAAITDPDQRFAAMMALHQQGAIDMARIYLKAGKDAELRRIAEKTVTGQEMSIRELQDLQTKHHP